MATDRSSTITEYRMTPITYRCTARTHHRAWIREGSTLWRRGDGWAYCASRLSLGHRWENADGVPLHELLTPQPRALD